MKLEYVVVHVYENISDKFDSGPCQIKVKSRWDLDIFLQLPQVKLSGPITQLWCKLGS